MSNQTFFDSPESDDDVFRDEPDEIVEGQEAAPVNPRLANPVPRPQKPDPRKTAEEIAQERMVDDVPEVEEESEDSEDFTTVLSDARLRLEQGRLYEMIMNHDIFQGVEVDPKAVKFVQKQIRNFAKEQMEIMLGMRQEPSQVAGFPMESFPFNSLEVEVLKMLASTATKGATAEAEPFTGPSPGPARTSINPIGKSSGQTRPVAPKPVAKRPLATKPAAPVTRTKKDIAIQRILEEEGVTMEEVNAVFDPKREQVDLTKLTPDEIIERNSKIKNRRATNPGALPMPTPEQIEAVITQRANQAAANPQMQMIMGAIERSQNKK